jgi:hypothetical protein
MVALLTVPFLIGACATGGQQDQAAEPSAQATGGECNGRWEIQVRNRNRSDQSVDVYFMRTAVSNPERAGTVNPQDERSFYIMSDSLWEVWASLGGQRILVRDQPTQQRYQVYVSVVCDTR